MILVTFDVSGRSRLAVGYPLDGRVDCLRDDSRRPWVRNISRLNLAEHWLEGGDNSLYEINHGFDCFEDWLSNDYAGLTNRKVKSKLKHLVDLRIRSVDKQFVASLEREHSISWPEERGELLRIDPCQTRLLALHRSEDVRAQVDASKRGAGSYEHAMLVNVVQLV